MSVLKVKDLNVRFRTVGPVKAKMRGIEDPFVDAVLDVSIKVRPGETVGLVGESGSGKTTLGRTILNLQHAEGGTVRFEGQEIRNMPEARFKPLRRDMAMMFQDPIGSLSPRKSVRALITEPLQVHGVKGVNLDEEAEPSPCTGRGTRARRRPPGRRRVSLRTRTWGRAPRTAAVAAPGPRDSTRETNPLDLGGSDSCSFFRS